MMSNKLELYIHIPFCQRKCLYCDFCSFEGTTQDDRKSYVDSLIKEIHSYHEEYKGYEVDSIYFGGGTPSLLDVEDTKRILDAIQEEVNLTDDVEITSEVNPATCDEEKLKAWHDMGINRLSVGVQSFNDVELKLLGRLHSAKEAEEFLHLANKVGFENLSLDLMYNIPKQTKESFTYTLQKALSLPIKHLSCYSLKIEEGTPFYKNKDSLHLMTEDEEVDLYDFTDRALNRIGFEHYEISNYALPNYESRHNLGYWQMKEYIGFGVAAYSYFKGKRYGHDRDIQKYMTLGCTTRPMGEDVTLDSKIYDTIMLGLRTKYGIEEQTFKKTFGFSFYGEFQEKIQKYISLGLMRYDGIRTSLTIKGYYVSLAILSDILEDY